MGAIAELDLRRQVLPQPGHVLLPVAGVDDHQEVVLAAPIDDQVVEDASVLPAEQRVLRSANPDLGHVIGQQAL